jgi:hypothetical protein
MLVKMVVLKPGRPLVLDNKLDQLLVLLLVVLLLDRWNNDWLCRICSLRCGINRLHLVTWRWVFVSIRG